MDKYYVKRNEEYLEHHGIKGQKWGIRRYQNEDGTFTAEGKKRYGVDSNGKISKEGAKLWKQDRKSALKEVNIKLKENGLETNYFKRSDLVNGERIGLAKKFISEKYGKTTMQDYVKNESAKRKISKGSLIVGSILGVIGTTVILNAARPSIIRSISANT